jgi:hypothetical protein
LRWLQYIWKKLWEVLRYYDVGYADLKWKHGKLLELWRESRAEAGALRMELSMVKYDLAVLKRESMKATP